ncbi:MAG TPA: hypothetical protein EYP23_01065 [Thermoplasmata archaeon]|nr:hypothetical protein [Thermoplasmata archaeon]
MIKKSVILSAAALIVLSSFSSAVNPQLINADVENSDVDTFEEKTGEADVVEIRVLHVGKNRVFKETVKKLTLDEKKELMERLTSTLESSLTLKEKLEEELEILKEYELVADNTSLQGIVDVNRFARNAKQIENRTQVNFVAHFAPILMVGAGFAGGIGFRTRVFNIFSFLFVIIIAGAVACFDPFESILYFDFVFTYPVLLGFLAGFTGLMMFAVIPGRFYSNLVALGVTSFTFWVLMPPLEQ